MPELIAKVKRQLNPLLKKQTEAGNIYTFVDLKIDLNDHKVNLDNQDIHLSKTLFSILAYLLSHAGKLVM